MKGLGLDEFVYSRLIALLRYFVLTFGCRDTLPEYEARIHSLHIW